MDAVPSLTWPFDSVEGLVSPADKIALAQLAGACRQIPGDCLEIGSNLGLSSLCILHGLGETTKTLHCFDIFEPEKLAAFRRHVSAAGYRNVVTVAGSFVDHEAALPDPIALAFLDHDHELDTTRLAVDWIWPRLSTGGLLAVHDFGHPLWLPATRYLETLSYERLPQDSIPGAGMIVFRKG